MLITDLIDELEPLLLVGDWSVLFLYGNLECIGDHLLINSVNRFEFHTFGYFKGLVCGQICHNTPSILFAAVP